MNQLPSIGRIVHYTNLGDKDGKYPPEVQAAILTGIYVDKNPNVEVLESANKVGDTANCMWVDLLVFYRTGFFQCQKIPYSDEPKRGHWNWPPKV